MSEVIGWLLTVVVFANGQVSVGVDTEIRSMAQCFIARDRMIDQVRWPQPNVQLVCIPVTASAIGAF